MPADPLVQLLSERLLAAQDAFVRRAGWVRGALAPRVPPDVIREVSAALAPVIRQAVSEALAEHAPRPVHVYSPETVAALGREVARRIHASSPDLPTGAGERPVGDQAGAALSGERGPGPSSSSTSRKS